MQNKRPSVSDDLPLDSDDLPLNQPLFSGLVGDFSKLPTDVISVIFSFLPRVSLTHCLTKYPIQRYNWGDDLDSEEKDQKNMEMFKKYGKMTGWTSSFFYVRLVCKKWNDAAIRCHRQWTNLLEQFGPKGISEKSVHDRRQHECKISKTTQKCCIATHYKPSTLVPKYDSKSSNAYKNVMIIFGKKFEKHIIAQKKHFEKKMEYCRTVIEQQQDVLNACEEKCEEYSDILEEQSKSYGVFVKKRKTKQSKPSNE